MATTKEQEATLLRAIVVSSSATWAGRPITAEDRQAAFHVLADFRQYAGRIPLCLQWLQETSISLPQDPMPLDCTLSTKLFACEIVGGDFLKHQYAKLSPEERLQVRQAVLVAARFEATSHTREAASAAVLSNKLASLLAALMIRDFPQRWTTCLDDLFHMWNAEVPMMGNKICLDVLKWVAEDCTDSDFNTKVGITNVGAEKCPICYRLSLFLFLDSYETAQ